MTSNTTTPDGKPETTPDYVGLVRFLMTPFLLRPEALKVDCKRSHQRVFVRLAIDEADRGRAYGRGGRNIDAVRHVLTACAQVAGEIARLDIFDGAPDAADPAARHGTPRDRHPAPPKPRLRSSAPDSDLETSPD
jgi:predicted RNA-binding protein YlqC (UPF0109 family)